MNNWTPNYDQITGIVRVVVPAIVSWIAAKGGTEVGTWEQIGIVAGVTIFACLWSVINNKSGKVISPNLSGRP